MKKTLPDPPPPPNHHLDDLTESFTGDCPTLRQSIETHTLHEKGKTALLQMLTSNPLPCHSSCHRRRAAMKMKTQAHQARPMEPEDRLQVAMEAFYI
jgi:hypothetical protein